MSNRPVKTYVLGKTKAAIFENEKYNSYSVKFQKSYMDKNKKWVNTDFFNFTDLRDLYALVGFMLDKQVKEQSINTGQQSENAGQVPSSGTGNIEFAEDNSSEEVPF